MKTETIVRFRRATEIAKIAGKHRIGPKVYDSYICQHDGKSYGITIMEYIQGKTLESEFHDIEGSTREERTRKQNQLILAASRLLRKLNELGIQHNDSHEENVLVQKQGKRWVAKWIDYGLSTFYEEPYLMELYHGIPKQTFAKKKTRVVKGEIEADRILAYLIQQRHV